MKVCSIDVTLWFNGVKLKIFIGTNFYWIFNVGFSFFTSKAFAIFLRRALLPCPLPVTSKFEDSTGKWLVFPTSLTKGGEW